MTTDAMTVAELPPKPLSSLEFRMRPVATPTGFRYHVDARPSSRKRIPQWRQVTLRPVTKEQAKRFIEARS